MNKIHKDWIIIAISILIALILFGAGDFVWYKHNFYMKTIQILDTRLLQERQKGHLSSIYYENELNRLRPLDINVPEDGAE